MYRVAKQMKNESKDIKWGKYVKNGNNINLHNSGGGTSNGDIEAMLPGAA